MDDQQLLDLMSEAGILTLNSICNQFDVHINKAKSILDIFSKSQKGLNVIYYISGLKDEKISISLIKSKDLKSKAKDFQKLFSIHIYAITNEDFDEEKLTVSPITAACGIRDITFPKKKAIKLPRPSEDATVDAETNNGIFKKRAPVKKGVAKAFSKIESKTEKTSTAEKEIKKEASTKVTKSNSKVSSFFGNMKPKKESKAAKKEVKATKKEPEPEDDELDNDAMDVDHSPKKVKKESPPSPHKRKTKNQNKETKPKRRRVQMDSSSEEDEQDEAQRLLFGDEEEDRLRNISIEEDKSEILAENTILTSDESEHEGVVDSEDEKENKPKKKKKTSFGTAKVIGDGKATKKVKKTRYHVDDEGNMVSEQYFEEEEIDEAELKAMQEKDRIEKEKKNEKIKKLTPTKAKPTKSTANKKQKSIASFFTKKK